MLKANIFQTNCFLIHLFVGNNEGLTDIFNITWIIANYVSPAVWLIQVIIEVMLKI